MYVKFWWENKKRKQKKRWYSERTSDSLFLKADMLYILWTSVSLLLDSVDQWDIPCGFCGLVGHTLWTCGFFGHKVCPTSPKNPQVHKVCPTSPQNPQGMSHWSTESKSSDTEVHKMYNISAFKNKESDVLSLYHRFFCFLFLFSHQNFTYIFHNILYWGLPKCLL
jgi:hypothetical protein